MARFAENLKALRLERGLTQAGLASRAGLAKSAISMYERGCRQPDLDRLQRLAQALRAPAALLLDAGEALPEPRSAAPAPAETAQNPQEAALLRDYRALDESARRDLCQYLRQAVCRDARCLKGKNRL